MTEEKYVPMEMEIISFDTKDVITTSGQDEVDL